MCDSPEPRNLDPKRIHAADEMYTQARNHLDRIMAHVRTMEPNIYGTAGNRDSSVLYDWLKGYILVAEKGGGENAHKMTVLMCAAALTRLVRDERTDATLAELDKEIEDHDDH